MQTPKEKAIEIFNKYYCLPNNSKKRLKVIELDASKQCALIAVDVVINSYDTKNLIYPKEVIYWNEVKSELEKM